MRLAVTFANVFVTWIATAFASGYFYGLPWVETLAAAYFGGGAILATAGAVWLTHRRSGC